MCLTYTQRKMEVMELNPLSEFPFAFVLEIKVYLSMSK